MGLSPIQRFKQTYLSLYERYVALQSTVPPDLYAQFTNSFKPRILTNYNLFIAIFESRSLATVGINSPYRAAPLTPAWLAPLHSQRTVYISMPLV